MLHTKFQASKPSGSEEDDFCIYFYEFYISNIGPTGPGPSWTLESSLNKPGRGSRGKYQISRP